MTSDTGSTVQTREPESHEGEEVMVPVPAINGLEQATDEELRPLVSSLKTTVFQMKNDFESRFSQVEQDARQKAAELHASLEATEDVLLAEFLGQEKKIREAVESELSKLKVLSSASPGLESVDDEEDIVISPGLTTMVVPQQNLRSSAMSTFEQYVSRMSVLDFDKEESSMILDGDSTLDPGFREPADDAGNEKRLSAQERATEKIRSAKWAKKHLTSDTFSFMIIAPTQSTPFILSIGVVSSQLFCFFLVAANMIDIHNKSNPFSVPPNVTHWVRVAQVGCLVVAVITQNDLITSFDLMRTGFAGMAKSFEATARWKYMLSTSLRFLEGASNLFLILVLAISSESVIDLLLNFTALEFVSQFDEAFFYLSHHGFLGLACEGMAYTLLHTSYCVARRPLDRIFKLMCMLGFFAVLLAGWGYFLNQQAHGVYSCQTIMVQFGDDMPDLGTFAGIYKKNKKGLPPFSSKHVEYIRTSQVGKKDKKGKMAATAKEAKIAYCEDINSWTLNWQEEDSKEVDPCNQWKARSAETETFDVTLAASSTWYFQDKNGREIILKPFYLSCYDCGSAQDCSSHGSCSDAVCTCKEGYFGPQCEFSDPCPTLQVSDLGGGLGGFPGIRKWNNTFKLLSDSNGTVVKAYERPVYIGNGTGQAKPSDWNILLFTGRRWLATYLDAFDDIPANLLESVNDTMEFLPTYFGHEFHAYWSAYKTEFLSEPMDIETLDDFNSPVGLNWYVAKEQANEDTLGIQMADMTLRVETMLLCSLCNNNTNPCEYDGVCVEGKCKCSLSSSGPLCEHPHIGNGHCDALFNKPAFDLDGGDCCSSTCITSQDHFCGSDDTGLLSVGYPFCHLPSDEWKLNSATIIGVHGSSLGYALAMSPSGNFLVTSGHRDKDKAYVYDKDGSEWKVRATLPLSDNSTRAPSDFDLVKLNIREVNIGQVNNPVRLAPLEITVLRNSTKQLQVYECKDSNTCQLTYPDVSPRNDYVIWFDMDTQGAVVLVRDFGPEEDISLDIVLPTETGYSFDLPDASITVPNDFVHDVCLSDDHQTLAVITRTRKNGNMTLNALRYSWNGTNFDLITNMTLGNMTTQIRSEVLSSAGKGSLQLSKDGLVLAISLCDTQQRVHVFDWDANASRWANRSMPPIAGVPCTWIYEVSTAKPPPNPYLQLSSSGDVLAFVENFFNNSGTEAIPEVWKWTGAAWYRIGDLLKDKSAMALGLSSDGATLALGLPFARLDNAGEMDIFSRPPNQKCYGNTSHWLFTHYVLSNAATGLHIPWILANRNGTIIQSGSLSGEPLHTFVKEACLEDTMNNCYIFTTFTDEGTELSSVIKYEMFLNGIRLSVDSQGTVFTRDHFIGNCSGSSSSLQKSSLQKCSNGESNLKVIGQSWSIEDLTRNFTVRKNNQCPDVDKLSERISVCLNISSGCYLFKSNELVQGDFGVRLYVNETIESYPRPESGPVFLGKGNGGCCPAGQVHTVFRLSSTHDDFQWKLSLSNGSDLLYGSNSGANATDCSPLDGPQEVKWEVECLDLMLCYNFTVVQGEEVTNARVWFSKNDVGVVQKGSSNETILFGNCTNSYLYGDPTVDPIPLGLGVSLVSQSGYTDQQYVVQGIPSNTNVTCKLEGNNGHVALLAYFQQEPYIRSFSFIPDAFIEWCTVGPSVYNNSAIIVEVQAMHPYTNLAITCELEGVYIEIFNSVPIMGLKDERVGHDQRYELHNIFLGDTVSCSLRGNNGDADLYLYLVEYDEPIDEPTCSSYNFGSNEDCKVGPAVNDSYILVARVNTWMPYTNVTLTCIIEPAGNITSSEVLPNAVPLLHGQILAGQSAAMGDHLIFVIENVTKDEYVWCMLSGDNGDADLYLYFLFPFPDDDANNGYNGCTSKLVGSNQDCVIGPADEYNTFAYAEVHANEDISGVTISCNVAGAPT